MIEKLGSPPERTASFDVALASNASKDGLNSQRPPPIEKVFATIDSNRNATFEQARRAYHDALQKGLPDRGRSKERAKCTNAAWERLKRFSGRR